MSHIIIEEKPFALPPKMLREEQRDQESLIRYAIICQWRWDQRRMTTKMKIDSAARRRLLSIAANVCEGIFDAGLHDGGWVVDVDVTATREDGYFLTPHPIVTRREPDGEGETK